MAYPWQVQERMPRRLPLSRGFSRYALDFIPDDYVQVPDDPTLDMGVGSYSLMFFVRIDPEPLGYLVNKGTCAGAEGRYRINTNGVTIWTDICDVLGVSSGSASLPVTTGELNHYALVINRTTNIMTTYLNLVESLIPQNIAGIGNVSSTRDLILGNYDNLGIGLRGLMDEVLFYQGRALTPYEIGHNILNYNKPLHENLVGWWRFEEGSGLVAEDLSGNGNNGALNAVDPPIWTRMEEWSLRVAAGF